MPRATRAKPAKADETTQLIPANDPAPPVEYLEEDEELEEIDGEVARIQTLLDDAPQEATVNIYRVPARGPLVYLCEIEPREFSIEYIKQNFGGGNYRVRGYQRNLDNSKQLFINRAIVIEESITERIARENQARMPQQQGGGFDMAAFANLMQQNNQAMIQSIAALMPKQDSKKDLLETMSVMKTIMGDGGGKQKDAIELVRELLDLKGAVKELNDEAPAESEIMQAVKTLGPLLAGLAQQNNAPQVPPQISHQQNPISPEAQEAHKMNMLQRAAITAKIKMLVKAAQKGGDPEMYAETVLAEVEVFGDEAMNALFEFLNADNYMSEIIVIEKDAANFQEWFSKLRELILAELTEGEEAATGDAPSAPAAVSTDPAA